MKKQNSKIRIRNKKLQRKQMPSKTSRKRQSPGALIREQREANETYIEYVENILRSNAEYVAEFMPEDTDLRREHLQICDTIAEDLSKFREEIAVLINEWEAAREDDSMRDVIGASLCGEMVATRQLHASVTASNVATLEMLS